MYSTTQLGLGTKGAINILKLHPLAIMLLCHVGFLFRLWPSSFPTFQATLSAQFKIFFFISRTNRLCCFIAEFTGFDAAFFFAQIRNELANLCHVLGLQYGSVGAHKQTKLSRHNTCFHVFDPIKNFIA
jgi:hypothetical protein